MRRYPIFLFSFVGCLGFLYASPQGFELISGEARAPVEVAAGHTLIESSGNTVISWDSFSIASHEALTFSQPSSSHYVLNQVAGSLPSDILGTLSSNGSVYLINPNGIFIGPDAVIETAGFLASTLDLCKEKMAEGVFSFHGDSVAAIVNQGTIRASDREIFLIARHVENVGALEAPGGSAVLATPDILIEKGGLSRIQIRPLDRLEEESYALLEENPYAYAIRHTGQIEAAEASLLAKGAILVEGVIDASLPEKGGSVAVHGDAIFIGKEARLLADAKEKGDGGKILLLGREKALFLGTASARGGAKGGDGGFAELSAPYLINEGLADMRAPQGRFGTLLIDPSDVNISTSGTTAGVDLTTDPVTLPADNTVTINNTGLTNQLQLGNVTITTVGTAGSGANNGRITVSSPIGNAGSWTAATTLTFVASSDIQVNAAITNTNASTGFTAINFTNNGVNNSVVPGISGSGTINTNGGAIILNGTGRNSSSSTGVQLLSLSAITGSGSITVTGSVPAGASLASYGVDIAPGRISSTSGDISVTGTTAGSGSTSYGVKIEGGTWNTGTTGALRFLNCFGSDNATDSEAVRINGAITHAGDLFFTNCVGGNNGTSGGYGVAFRTFGAATISGDLIATDCVGRGNNGVGFFKSGAGQEVIVTGTGNEISISASSTGTGPISYAIMLAAGAIRTTGGGNISLIGSSTNSIGIYVTGSNMINSNSGNITLTGTSSGDTGVLINAAQNTLTTGSLTFLNCSGGAVVGTTGVLNTGALTLTGDLVFTNCSGSDHGVSISSNCSIAGDLIATDCVATGISGLGFSKSGSTTISVTGAGKQISISASGIGSSARGISLSAGTIQTTGGGSITLNGTGSLSGSSAHGIQIASGVAPRISTATGGGDIILIGTALGTNTTNRGILISLANAIATTTGDISLNGSSAAPTGFGTSLGTNLVTEGGSISISGSLLLSSGISLDTTNSGAAPAGNNITFSSTINGAQSLTLTGGSSGVVSLQGGVGLTTALTGLSVSGGGGITLSGGTIRTAGGAASFTGPITLSSSGALVNTTNNGASPAGNNITFSSTINGGAPFSLSYGTAGVLSLSGAIGGVTPVTSVAITGASIPLNVAVTTASGGVALTGSSGITLSGGTIRTAGGAASFTGPVTLSSTPFSVDTTNSGGTPAGNNITFSSTVNGAQNLTLTGGSSGVISLQGAVGLTTAPTALSVTGSAITLSGSSIRTAGGAASFTGPVTLSSNPLSVDTTNSGGTPAGNNITFSSTVNGAQNLTLTGGSSGVISLQGAIGLTAAPTALSVTGGGITLSGGAIRTAGGAASFTGPVTLSSSGALVDTTNNGGSAAGNNITFSSTINGGAPLSLSYGTAGVLSLSGAIGGVTPVTSVAITGASIPLNVAVTTASGGVALTGSSEIILSGSTIRTAGGAASFTGPITLASVETTIDTTNDGGSPAGSTITLGAVNGLTASGQSLTLNAGTGGNTLFNGPIGDATPLLSFSSLSPINGASDLICTADTVTFNGAVGNITPLTSLVITADAIEVHNDQTVSTGAMTYGGPVALFGNTVFSKTGAGAVSFNGALSAASLASGLGSLSGNFDVEINAPLSTVSCEDTIDLTGAAGSGAHGGSFTVLAGGSVTLEGAVLTHGASSGGAGGNGGAVAISSTNGSISVHNIYTYGGAGATTGQGGDITLAPSSSYLGGYPAGLIILNEDLGVEGNLVATLAPNGSLGATITLDAGRGSYPTVATIVSSFAGNDIDILGEEVVMGENEALTALGNLNIEGTTLTLSDLVALEDMNLIGETLNLLEHGEVFILAANGELEISPSLHWQSGGAYTRIGALNPPGGIVDELSLALTPEEFLPLLSFEDHILNYDGDAIIPPPTPSGGLSEEEKEKMVYTLGVADAELSDNLPPITLIESPEPVRFTPSKRAEDKEPEKEATEEDFQGKSDIDPVLPEILNL